jgi:hypothetical protein
MEGLAKPPTFWAGNERGVDEAPNLKLYSLEGVMNGYDPMHLREVCDVMCTTPTNKAFRRVIYSSEPTALNTGGHLLFKRQFWLTRQYVNGSLPEKNVSWPSTTTVFLDDPGRLPIPEVDRAQLPRTGVSSEYEKLTIYSREEKPFVLNSADFKVGSKALQLKPITLPPLHSSLLMTMTTSCPVELTPVFKDIKSGQFELGKMLRVSTPVKSPQTFAVPMPDIQEVQVNLKPDFKAADGEVTIFEATIMSDVSDENARINVVSRSANSMEVDLNDLPGHRMLVCVDAFYPGWRAYVDGAFAPIYRADKIFKGVIVPPGSHRVTFVYHSFRVTVGIVLASFTLVGMLFTIFLLLRKPKDVMPIASARNVASRPILKS